MFNKTLSPDKKALIHFGGIYEATPEDFRNDPLSNSRYWDVSGAYHCRSWNFRPYEAEDGTVRMYDTYWLTSSDNFFYLNDDNFSYFRCLMEDEKEWRHVCSSDVGDYDPSDVVRLGHTSSGEGKYYLRRDASPVAARKIARAKDKLVHEIDSVLASYELGLAKRTLEGTMKDVDMSVFDDSADYDSMRKQLEECEEINLDEYPSTSNLLEEDREVGVLGGHGYYWIDEGLTARLVKTVDSDRCGKLDVFAIEGKDLLLFCDQSGSRASAVVLSYENYIQVMENDAIEEMKLMTSYTYEHRCADVEQVLGRASKLIAELERLKEDLRQESEF